MRIVYFSSVPWTSFPQRPHKFVEWLHVRYAADVLWIDPYPTRFPSWTDLRRLHPKWSVTFPERLDGVFSWLRILTPPALSVEPMVRLDALNGILWKKLLAEISEFLSGDDRCIIGIGKPSSLALQSLKRYPYVMSLLDAMDDYPAFYEGLAKETMTLKVNEIASRVSRILISSEALRRRFKDQKHKLTLVRNACDVDRFPSLDPSMGDGNTSILGYIGTVGKWFDWQLVFALAKSDPSVHIRLVGPIYKSVSKPIPDNVEILPPCDHDDAIEIMQGFSVGLIPFKYTELTYAVDPIKYYEYRSLGLPVLSSRFGSMAFRDAEPGVFLMDRHDDDLASKIRSALSYRYDRKEIADFRNRNSWSIRFDESRILEDWSP